LEYPRSPIGDSAEGGLRTLKAERRATDVVIALLSRRLPPVRTSILLIAASCAAIALLHPAPASAATGTTDPAAKTAAAGHPAAKAGKKKKAPAFHEDRTPLGADVASAGASKGKAPAAGSAGADVIRTIVGLAVVLGVIYGVYWLLKSSARAKAGRGDERIGVIATTPLAPNRSLHLVRAGDELILVGATDQSITPLRVYSADEAILVEGGGADVPLQLSPASPSGREGFLEILRKRTARA
jgi:flagellar protein FliO/FliZ